MLACLICCSAAMFLGDPRCLDDKFREIECGLGGNETKFVEVLLKCHYSWCEEDVRVEHNEILAIHLNHLFSKGCSRFSCEGCEIVAGGNSFCHGKIDGLFGKLVVIRGTAAEGKLVIRGGGLLISQWISIAAGILGAVFLTVIGFYIWHKSKSGGTSSCSDYESSSDSQCERAGSGEAAKKYVIPDVEQPPNPYAYPVQQPSSFGSAECENVVSATDVYDLEKVL